MTGTPTLASSSAGWPELVLAWARSLFLSLRSGQHRSLRCVALGVQIIFTLSLVSHPRLIFPFFPIPTLFGGCTFCPRQAVTTVDYRSSRDGGRIVKVGVCERHVHGAPAKYYPKNQILENFWLYVPLFLFYGFILLLLLGYGYFMLEPLKEPELSRHARLALMVLLAGVSMTAIVLLHARQAFIVTVFGDEFDASRWLFWLALPITTIVVLVASLHAYPVGVVGKSEQAKSPDNSTSSSS